MKGQSILVILGVAISAIVSDAMASGKFDLFDTMMGLILFVVLAGYWRVPSDFPGEYLAYAGAMGYVWIMIFGFLADHPLPILPVDASGAFQSLLNLVTPETIWEDWLKTRDFWIFLIWLGLSAAIYHRRRRVFEG